MHPVSELYDLKHILS